MKRVFIIIASLLLAFSFGSPVYAMGHAGGHASGGHSSGGHASASHATASHSAVHSAGSHASASHGVNVSHPATTRSSTSRPINRAASRLPNTQATRRSIRAVQHSTTYRSLKTSNQRSSYAYYRGYYDTYHPHQSANTIMQHHYYWMPVWLANSNTAEIQSIKNDATRNGLKWVSVDGDKIAVPDRIYRTIKVGDHVTLLDDSHLIINGKTYTI